MGKTWSQQQQIGGVAIRKESYLNTSIILKDIVFTDEQNGYAVGALFSDGSRLYNSIIETHDGGTVWRVKNIFFTLPTLNSSTPFYSGLYKIPNTKNILSLGSHSLRGNPYIAINDNNSDWRTLFLGNGYKEFITFGNDTTEYDPIFLKCIFLIIGRQSLCKVVGIFTYLKG